MPFRITEHVVRTARHTTFYLACGHEDAPVIIFAHGWPELSISWRHQLPVFGALGFRAIAPDMRGFGDTEQVPIDATRGLRDWADDTHSLVQALGIDRPLHLAGWST